jgi:hypothetical protein
VPQIDLVDATWIAAQPQAVADIVADQRNWAQWWPGMNLAVERFRGVLGVQWQVLGCTEFAHRATAGSMEVWIEAVNDGATLHYFLRLDGADKPLRPSSARRAQKRHAHRAKKNFWAVKDRLEQAR